MTSVRRSRRAFLHRLVRLGGAVAGVGALAGCAPASMTALPAPRIYRVGVLNPMSGRLREFWARLTELGYVEGQNLDRLERTFTEPGGGEELDTLLHELVALPADAIVAVGVLAARATLAATSVIPIVMAGVTDPVGAGLVASLARSGNNATGTTDAPLETDLKRLQLLVEALPGTSRVGVLLGASAASGGAPVLSDATWEAAARAVGVDLEMLRVASQDDLEPAVERAAALGCDALVVPDALAVQLGALAFVSGGIKRLAERYGLPAIYAHRGDAIDGGLIAYVGRALFRRTADYVDLVLRGAHPSDLPIETPNQYDLIVNLRTARALGITFPTTFLARVDEIIE